MGIAALSPWGSKNAEIIFMGGDAPITWLMFFTLAAGIVVAAGLFIAFLRSRHNREIAGLALAGDGRTRRGEPSGAGIELGGLLVVCLVAMGLLAFGYRTGPGSAAPLSGAAQDNQPTIDRAGSPAAKP